MAVMGRSAPQARTTADRQPRSGAPTRANGVPVRHRPPTRGVLHSLEQLLDIVLRGKAVAPVSDDGVVLDVTVAGYRWIAIRDGACPDAVSLSPREAEIARMVAAGLTNKAIASVLDISPWTVGTYLRRIFVKLEVNSRAAMTAAVARLHLATQDALDLCDTET